MFLIYRLGGWDILNWIENSKTHLKGRRPNLTLKLLRLMKKIIECLTVFISCVESLIQNLSDRFILNEDILSTKFSGAFSKLSFYWWNKYVGDFTFILWWWCIIFCSESWVFTVVCKNSPPPPSEAKFWLRGYKILLSNLICMLKKKEKKVLQHSNNSKITLPNS